ncbi:hypothetical protein LZ31DRAFT_84678 [Colletotrichum somersetense]|nr:hypothetical protein LZ31DRAFT_84678 [Colletotrichum somersetense]
MCERRVRSTMCAKPDAIRDRVKGGGYLAQSTDPRANFCKRRHSRPALRDPPSGDFGLCAPLKAEARCNQSRGAVHVRDGQPEHVTAGFGQFKCCRGARTRQERHRRGCRPSRLGLDLVPQRPRTGHFWASRGARALGVHTDATYVSSTNNMKAVIGPAGVSRVAIAALGRMWASRVGTWR